MLAAMSFTIDIGTILSIGGPLVAIAGTIAVMKWRQGDFAEKQKEQKEDTKERSQKLEAVDDKIFEKIEDLGKTMTHQFRAQNQKMAESEKSMIGRIDTFQDKVFHRLDDVSKELADHDKRLSLSEQEQKHTKAEVEKHGRKITFFGQAMRKDG